MSRVFEEMMTFEGWEKSWNSPKSSRVLNERPIQSYEIRNILVFLRVCGTSLVDSMQLAKNIWI